MKTKPTQKTLTYPRAGFTGPQKALRAVGACLLAVLISLGLVPSAKAQPYTLSNAWNIAIGTGHIAVGDVNRGIAYSAVSNQVFIANRTTGTTGFIDVFDGTTGALLSGSTGISGANLGIDQVGVSDDGVLYATPLTTSVSGTTGSLTIYSWTNWFNNPTPYAAYVSTSGDPVVANFTGKRIGDSMAVTGSGTNTLILMAVPGAGAGCTNFVLLHTADGSNFTATVVLVPTGLPSIAGNIMGLSFYTNGTFLVYPGSGAANRNVFLVSYPANFASQTSVVGTVLGNAATLTSSLTTAINYSPAGQMLAVVQTANTAAGTKVNTNSIFSMTNFPTSAIELARVTNATATANGNATGGAALGGAGKTNFLYVLECNNGVRAYAIIQNSASTVPTISSAPAAASGIYPSYSLNVGVAGTAPFGYQWLASNSGTNISSTFTNIPGATNNSFAINSPSTNYYEVIITNSVGSVTSAPVRVALLTPVTSTVVTQLWRIATGTAGFSYLGTDGTTRGMGYDTNSQRLVVANTAGTIYILDANSGTNLGTLNMSTADLAGGTFALDQVVVADDGAVYSGNLAGDNSKHFKVNRWASPTTNVTSTVAYDDSGPGTLKITERWGDSMAVRGAGTGTQILLAGRNGTNVALLTTADGLSFSATIIAVSGVPAGFSGLGITFGDGNTFWSKTSGGDLRKIAFDPLLGTGSVIFDYTTPGQIPSSMVGVGVDSVNNILAGIVINDIPHDMQLFQLTGTADAPVMFHQGFFASGNVNGNGSVAIAMKYPRVYGLDAVNGLVAMTYGIPPSAPPSITTPPASRTVYTNIPSVIFGVSVTGSLPIYYQWRFNGTNIVGATNSTYTLNTPPLSKAGNYDVVVRNIAGSVTSTPPALLTLIAPVTSVVVTQLWTLAVGSQAFLDGSTYNTRGLAYDTNSAQVLVADHANIHVLSATNGSYLGDLNPAGIYNGGLNGWLFDQVGVADDGALYAANLTLTGPNFSIVTWSPGFTAGSPASSYAYGGGSGGDPGSGSGERWGDTMDVRGSGVNTEILLGSYSGTNALLFTTTDGSSFTPNVISVTNVPAGFGGQGIAFGDGDSFYSKSPGFQLRKVAFDRSTWKGGAVLNYPTMPSQFDGIGVDVTAGILGGVNFSDTPTDLQLYLLSGNANPPSLFDQAFFASVNLNSQFNAVTTLKGGKGYSLNVNNGITAISYGTPAAPAVLITSVGYAPGAVTLNWNNTFNTHTYQVQYKDNLLDPTWNNVGSPVTASGPTASYLDTTATGATRFYRVISQ